MIIRREPLTRLRIIKLALDIIDTEGLPALNMRRLAAAAGVKPMSLYHHFPDKHAILGAVAEWVAAEALCGAPTTGTWQERARLLFAALHALVRTHPRALPLVTTGLLGTVAGRRWIEELMGVLLGAGFTPDAAARVYRLLAAFTLGLGYAQLLSLEAPAETVIGALTSRWADYPNLLRVGLQVAVWDQPLDFATGVDVLLERVAEELEDAG